MNFPPHQQVDFQLDRARLFSRAPQKIYFGHIASAMMLIYLAWDVLPVWILGAWACLEIVLTPVLLFLLGRQAREPEKIDLAKWQTHLHLLFLAIGISWGLFVFFGLDIENSAHFSIQIAIVAGASAAASRSLGIFKFSFFYYEIPFAGLLALRLFLLGSDLILLGVLVVIFLVMMCGLANDVSDELSDYLATKSDNLELARKFEAAAQEAQRANKAKSQFLAQANHDLRQPIHAIGLLTECLRDQRLNRQGLEILETIDISIENLARLFKSLLNISSLDSGKLKPEITVFPIEEVISQTLRQARPEAIERGIDLRSVTSSTWVRTDKALLSSILQNLVFNAVKYAPDSKILVGVRNRGGQLCIQVLDQGIGVPKDQQQDIFNEFTRGSVPGSGEEGLGLGLSIVRRTADLLNLGIRFNSELDTGTHVSIDGLERSAPEANTLPKTQRGNSQQRQGDITVLVVDDAKTVLDSMGALLRKWGYRVKTRLPTEPLPENADLLLFDLHLGIDKTGIDLAQDYAQRAGGPIPTCIISGTVDIAREEQIRETEFYMLHKPVPPLQLRSILLTMEAEQLSISA
jgi:signal transduction histidine kinase/CheY-like chemotaxis protein